MATRGTTTRASSRAKATTPNPESAGATTRSTRSRTAATTTSSQSKSTSTGQAPTRKTTTRKPLANKANEIQTNNVDVTLKTETKPLLSQKTVKLVDSSDATDREPITAYLRIRPQLGDEPMSMPYLTPLSNTTVRMADPQESQANLSRYRASTVSPSSIYTFSHVFPPQATQSDFFTKTTLPLVHDVLMGQSGLLFTYGVTNSGKTYTIQGGTTQGSAGILPRTLDVLFNSIEGLHGDGRYRPIRLYGVEPADPSDMKPAEVEPIPAIAEVLGQQMNTPELDIDPTVIPVDRNYEYTIWLSYVEVYNEKVYDLLESVKEDTPNIPGEHVDIPTSASGKSLLLTRKALALKPSPPSDSGDSGLAGKYIAGLKQFRVHNAAHAKALVKLGQLHRRVFGTLANRESSRSHGMVIVKVMRGHKGERNDPSSLQIARLTLVDLAGSERTKHTQTTGERLKEAGNINKSLMVLGQCMEVIRNNQRKLAMSLSQNSRMETKDVKKGLAIVPFRHSKLTEALMDYFMGDGRTIMIVNVNPFDTGYDENSHVMKFAALTREVYITPVPAPLQRVPSAKASAKVLSAGVKMPTSLTMKNSNILPAPRRRKVTISMGGPGSGRKASEAVLEVLEGIQMLPILVAALLNHPTEDEPNDASDEDDEPINPLVDALFDEIETLRMQLYEAEMRCAVIEAETREEVMHEMEERMRSMEDIHSRRLMREFQIQQQELRTDAKIDMLHQSGLFGSPVKNKVPTKHLHNFDEDEDEDEDEGTIEECLRVDSQVSDMKDEVSDKERLSSPLAEKTKGKMSLSNRLKHNSTRNSMDEAPVDNDSDLTNEEEELDDEDDERDDDDDEWVPPVPTSSKQATSKNEMRRVSNSSQGSKKTTKGKSGVARIEQELNQLSLHEDTAADDSMVILPTKKSRVKEPADIDEADEDSDEVKPTGPKKKKR
ncbi:hypothetical protein AMATHDRAFT_47579 [Amanita thiersii Skay4041]|uniref:Kinesin-like protein n=1 Tax=Amanita thiersii Skay4041 TaxID=703135 RepID=A0A2A9NSX6_9AGAR|nr:hypothetical protein AMATHDRAFT_47579 [Amanita thiersii Skay4041]